MGRKFQAILAAAEGVPGWTQGKEAELIALASLALPPAATIVEIGVFMGRATILLAGPQKLGGGGVVHCVDPFDGSGDGFSVPVYAAELAKSGAASLFDVFRRTMRQHGLDDGIVAHCGRAEDVGAGWSQPIDLLLLDGDQSVAGARRAYEVWSPFLKAGGEIILRNTRDRAFAKDHDGHRRLVQEEITPPRYAQIRQVGATTFARKCSQASP